MGIGVLGMLDSPLLGLALSALQARKIEVSAVLIDSKSFDEEDAERWKERTGGRIATVPLSSFANEKIPFYFVDSHNDTDAVQLVQDIGLSILVNGGTPRILKKGILSATKYGVLNIHPGKLPDYRGCTAPEWAIFNNDQIFNTVHYMSEEIDGGPIVMSEGYAFSRLDNYIDIRTKVYREGYSLLARSVSKVLNESMTVDSMTMQTRGGNYYKPISETNLEYVKELVSSGKYMYQNKK